MPLEVLRPRHASDVTGSQRMQDQATSFWYFRIALSRMNCTQWSMWTYNFICSKDPDRWSTCCYLAMCTSVSSWCVCFQGWNCCQQFLFKTRNCSRWSFRICHVYKGAVCKTILKCCVNIISFILMTPLWREKNNPYRPPHYHQIQCSEWKHTKAF